MPRFLRLAVLFRLALAVWIALGPDGITTGYAAPRVTLRFTYDAPPGCPAAHVFEEAVLNRLASPRIERSLEVRIVRDQTGFRGILRVPESSDADLAREVSSADCAELVRALGLVGAVLVDPRALRHDSPTPSPPPGPQARTQVEASRTSPGPALAGPWRWTGHAGLGMTAQTGLAPKLALGPRLSFDLGRQAPAGRLGYAGRVSVAGVWRSRAEGALGDAEFSWLAPRLEACAMAASGSRFAVTPCALTEVGQYWARGRQTQDARAVRSRWLALGSSIRADMRLIGSLGAYAEGAVAAPLRRPHFYFVHRAEVGGVEPIHRVPRAVFSTGFGLAAHFP